jgi:formamidopyrimidine-DNA glycosylase
VPELPEVEVLARHLGPLLERKRIREVQVCRPKMVLPASVRSFRQTLRGATFTGWSRRGKYLLFSLRLARPHTTATLVGHLGMTGRMYLLPVRAPLPKHTAVVLNLGSCNFVFEDTRYFGRLTLETGSLAKLGPEPLGPDFTVEAFRHALQRSNQPIKVKLLDQSFVAGIGNIYASEALFRAGVSPRLSARRLTLRQVERLWQAIRETLTQAIQCGSTVPLGLDGTGERDGLFYFGRAAGAEGYYEERLRVYDRAGRACSECGTVIKRVVQAARSTFYCPGCQRP